MMHLAKIAGKYFDYAEIIEFHHNLKIDAPSGTALSTAKSMAQAKGKPFNRPPVEKGETLHSRGTTTDGISIHSRAPAGINGASGSDFRGRRTNSHHPPRYHRPGLLYARRDAGDQSCYQTTGPHHRAGTHPRSGRINRCNSSMWLSSAPKPWSGRNSSNFLMNVLSR